MTRRIATAFALCAFGIFASSDASGSLTLTVDCTTETVSVVRGSGVENEDFGLVLVLAKEAASDPACAIGPPVEVRRRIVDAGSTQLQFGFEELGIEIPSGCANYVVGALAESFLEGGASVVSGCSPPTSPLTTVNCNQPPYRIQIENDLIFYNEIDVGRIGTLHDCGIPDSSTSCPGLQVTEYIAEVRSRPTATNNYDVLINAWYICTSCAATPVPCDSPLGSPNPGPGWNMGFVSVLGLTPDSCFAEKFKNTSQSTELPTCCDTAKAAMQCGRMIVTKVGDTLCSYPFFGPLRRSDDGGVALGFNCKFDPTYSNVLGATTCNSIDGNLDGVIDGCLCGNGVLDPGEMCDGSNLNNETCELQSCGTEGTLRCAADCKSFDTTACSECIDECKCCPACDFPNCPSCP